MDAYEAILTKRDTRDYEDRAIPDEVMRRILQAGRMAGSSRNEQPIRTIVVRTPEQKTALGACGRTTDHLVTCPLVIVIVRAEGSRAFDAGRAGQNMMIAAQAEGITSCPVGTSRTSRRAKYWVCRLIRSSRWHSPSAIQPAAAPRAEASGESRPTAIRTGNAGSRPTRRLSPLRERGRVGASARRSARQR